VQRQSTALAQSAALAHSTALAQNASSQSTVPAQPSHSKTLAQPCKGTASAQPRINSVVTVNAASNKELTADRLFERNQMQSLLETRKVRASISGLIHLAEQTLVSLDGARKKILGLLTHAVSL